MQAKATWWAQATAGVNYYRAEMPAKHLPGKSILLDMTDLQEKKEGHFTFPRQEGAAIWLFPGNTTRALLISEMMDQGVPCFFEADDNYTIPPAMAQISEWQMRFDGSDSHSFEICTRISKFCDGIIVSTPALRDVYYRRNKNIHVCMNCIDPDDWDEPVKIDDGILRIGYAASISHIYDAADIYRAMSWAADQPDVEVVLMGINPGWKFPHRHIEWVESLEEYRRSLGQIDIMLCPLRNTAWGRCKSDIKAMEAAMGGAMSVVSDAEPWEPWHERTYSAATAKEFLKVVKYLVKNRDEVPQLARQAREYVLAERTIQKGIRQWEDALMSVGSLTTPSLTTA